MTLTGTLTLRVAKFQRGCEVDPNVTMSELLTALIDGDRDEAVQRLEALGGWLSSGGFFPSQINGTDLVDIYDYVARQEKFRKFLSTDLT